MHSSPPIRNSAAFLQKLGYEKAAFKLLRASYPREWKHLDLLGLDFTIIVQAGAGYDIYWQGQYVSTVKKISPEKDLSADKAWIVASGPSLQEVDLSTLEGKATFAVNGAISAFVEAGITPHSSVIVDPDFFRNRPQDVIKAIELSEQCYLSSYGIKELLQQNITEINWSKIHLLEVVSKHSCRANRTEKQTLEEWLAAERSYQHCHPEIVDIGWSTDPNKGVFGGRTVVFAALQLIEYLDYQHVNILGMDMGSVGGQRRFYQEDSQNIRPSRLEEDFERVIKPCFSILNSRALDTLNVNNNNKLKGVIPGVGLVGLGS